MQSLWNTLLLIIFLIFAAKLHTLDNDKTMLESDKDNLQKRLDLAERRKSVTQTQCEKQKVKFVELKKTSDYKEEQIEHQADQILRLKLKKEHLNLVQFH